MTKKRTSHKTPKPRGVASGIPVFCLHDEIVDAASLKLWSEQPGQKNPQVHPAKQLDRYELVVAGDGRKPGNGFRRCAVVSTLSGCVTKGNGLVMMARRRGWQVPIERQAYANRAEEIRDVAADNRIAEMAELDPGEIQFGIGDSVTVADGASKWMRERGFWIDEWPESIDGMTFEVVADYTHLRGDSAHWWLENDVVKDCGVNPTFLLPNVTTLAHADENLNHIGK